MNTESQVLKKRRDLKNTMYITGQSCWKSFQKGDWLNLIWFVHQNEAEKSAGIRGWYSHFSGYRHRISLLQMLSLQILYESLKSAKWPRLFDSCTHLARHQHPEPGQNRLEHSRRYRHTETRFHPASEKEFQQTLQSPGSPVVLHDFRLFWRFLQDSTVEHLPNPDGVYVLRKE